jgi:hypothetical protein
MRGRHATPGEIEDLKAIQGSETWLWRTSPTFSRYRGSVRASTPINGRLRHHYRVEARALPNTILSSWYSRPLQIAPRVKYPWRNNRSARLVRAWNNTERPRGVLLIETATASEMLLGAEIDLLRLPLAQVSNFVNASK